MQETLARVLRTAQTFVPQVADAKYEGQRLVRRLRSAPFEADFRALAVLAQMRALSLCVDVGGNRGQSIDAIRLFLPQAGVHTFEPNPRLAQSLERRHESDARLHVHTTALGESAGYLTLHVPVYNGYVFDGLASVHEAEARDWLEGRIIGYSSKKLQLLTYRVRVMTLDELQLDPQFMKIDVQGAEAEVLRGGLTTLREHRPFLLVEAPSAAVTDVLDPLGYRAHYWQKGRLRRAEQHTGPRPVNTFFLPDA